MMKNPFYMAITGLMLAFVLAACGTPAPTPQGTLSPSPVAPASPTSSPTVIPTILAMPSAQPSPTPLVVGQKVSVAGGAFTRVSPDELKTMLARKDFVFVNTHIPYEGEIERTDAFIPFDTLAQNLQQLPADKHAQIFLYCRSGRMSTEAAETLVKLGYTNVWELGGGMLEWARNGLPLIQK